MLRYKHDLAIYLLLYLVIQFQSSMILVTSYTYSSHPNFLQGKGDISGFWGKRYSSMLGRGNQGIPWTPTVKMNLAQDEAVECVVPCLTLQLDLYELQDEVSNLETAYVNYASNLGEREVDASRLISLIDKYFHFRDVPILIDESVVELGHRQNDVVLYSKLLSLAASFSLSSQVTWYLLRVTALAPGLCEDIPYFLDLVDAFRSSGWDGVQFPRGMSLKVKRKYLSSRRKQFLPIPRRWYASEVKIGERAVARASKASPPRVSAEAKGDRLANFISTIEENEFSSRSLFASMKNEAEQLKNNIYFPRRNRFFLKFSKFIKNKSDQLKSTGRAGLISYGFLNFVWYTIALILSWNRFGVSKGFINANFVEKSRVFALRHAVEKFLRVLSAVYVGSQLTKLPRLCLAVGLTPFGDRALKYAQRKFEVQEEKAFLILTVFLFAVCFAVWSTVIFSDAAFMNATLRYCAHSVQQPDVFSSPFIVLST